MAYVRFPIPEFDYKPLKNMTWQEPSWLPDSEVARIVAAQKKGDASVLGAHPIKASDAFFDKLGFKGDKRHVVMCVLPDKPVKLVGRSRAWFIQRAVGVDSLDPGAMKTVFDWKTTRPICTRLGPDAGVTLNGGIVYVVCGRSFGDRWIGDRTILDNGWKKGAGFRVLAASDDGPDDFHEVCLTFEWGA